jgi:hypothetical protein
MRQDQELQKNVQTCSWRWQKDEEDLEDEEDSVLRTIILVLFGDNGRASRY